MLTTGCEGQKMLSIFRSGALRSALRGNVVIRTFAAGHGQIDYKPPKRFTKEDRIEQWDYVNSVFFGPERDLKNFPHHVMANTPPPVRLGIIPASWFDFFYKKTGVTGPYLFLGGFTLWMLSKEVMVIDHYFWEIPGFFGAMWVICYKFGDKIKSHIDGKLKIEENMYYTRPLNAMRKSEHDAIAANDRALEETETAKHLYQAKKEGVQLQLEAAYRQRLLTAFQEVKKRLDYEVEKENLKRKFEQDHMVKWIVSNVTKSITPQQEKESIQSCIRTLKNIAAKQAVA